jgi:hypothetical protein
MPHAVASRKRQIAVDALSWRVQAMLSARVDPSIAMSEIRCFDGLANRFHA